MKNVKRSFLTTLFYCCFLVYAQAAYLNPTMADPNNTWLGWYDAGLNTLPEQQGWAVYNNPQDTQPVVQNGLLLSKTTVLQYLYWDRTDKYLCYPADHGLVVEFELKINASQYVNIPYSRWRIGYTIWITDYQGRVFRIGIADTGVIISNDNDWYYINSTAFVPFNPTDGFHLYRFVIQNDIGQLEIDGIPIVSLAAGAKNEGTPNRILFGDPTFHAYHDAQMAWLRYGVTKKTGDTGNDGLVDMTDIERIVNNWLTGNCGCMSCCNGADLNHSGKVDLEDLAVLSLGWLG